MAEFNALQVRRFDAYVRRLAAIKQTGIIPTAAAELMLMLPFPTGLEDEFSAGRFPAGGSGAVQTNGAGETHATILRMPAATRALCFARFTVRCGNTGAGVAGGVLFLERGIAAYVPDASASLVSRDTRVTWAMPALLETMKGPPVATEIIYTDVAPTPQPGFDRLTFLPCVVAPGTWVQLRNATVNTFTQVAVEAFIREATADELAA